MNTLARLLIAFVLLLLGPLTVLADELPQDTNKIESLTVDQAKRLAKTFPGVDVTNQWDGITYRNSLPLNALKNLDADLAQALAGYARSPLILSGLTTLSPEAARALAEFKGRGLALNGLITLDADTAKELAEFKVQWLNLADKANKS